MTSCPEVAFHYAHFLALARGLEWRNHFPHWPWAPCSPQAVYVPAEGGTLTPGWGNLVVRGDAK